MHHPLAGVTLHFAVQISALRSATAEEIAQLLYQAQALMLASGVTLSDVYECL